MAQYEDLTIDQGTDVAIELELVSRAGGPAKNLTGHAFDARMKRSFNTDSDFSFTAVVIDPPTGGVVTLGMTNAQTAAIVPGRYVYGVEMSYVDSGGDTIKERVLEGIITVTPSV